MTSPIPSARSTAPAERPPYVRATELPEEVSAAFGLEPLHSERLGIGHINESFVAHCGGDRVVLFQAINHGVFTEPEKVMENLEAVLVALEETEEEYRTWSPLRLLRSEEGACSVSDRYGRLWRAFPFLSGTVTHTAPRGATDARRTALAFGVFQTRLRHLDPDDLHETIPRFHDTPNRYRQLDAAVAADATGRVATSDGLLEQAERHRPLARRLLDLHAAGDAPLRVVHNDAKISNVLFDDANGRPVCVVDLDTVMAGLGLYDFGDMVRSMAHTTEEDETDLSKVVARPDLFEALAHGFTAGARHLTPAEHDHLLDAGLVLVLEQGLRFLTDHLEGDHYFPAHREGHNLDRARTQFALLDSLLDQEVELRRRSSEASQ